MTHMRSLVGAAALSIAFVAHASAQTPAAQPAADALSATIAAASKNAVISDPPATFTFANRAITELRATVLGRPPAARVRAAEDRLKQLLVSDPRHTVDTRKYSDAIVVIVGGEPLFVIFQADVDALAGEPLDGKAAAAAAALQRTVAEMAELHDTSTLTRAIVGAIAVTAAYIGLLWLLMRLDRRIAARFSVDAENRLSQLPGAEAFVRAANASGLVRRGLAAGSVGLALVFTYMWLTFLLRRFPYTRPWGESLRSGLLSVLATVVTGFIDQLPNLAMLLVIALITRFFVRVVSIAFAAVEQGRVAVPYVYPETAQPTRRIVVMLLWAFALTVAYNYLPGSNSDVFKGISVFVGLVVSLGSSGIMSQAMSGLMITYARALKVGDFVKIDDIEGTVTHLGALSSKVKTPRNEEITIPNAVIASNATTNYSRLAETEGVYTPTSVTIGYDVPWRQVHALLLLAAERSSGIRRDPKPTVLQTALDDFYVRYTLLVCLERPQTRVRTFGGLHANIQDAFNEYGVQIMSPGYEADPEAPKIVPRSKWYAAPATPAEAVRPGQTTT